MSWCQCYQMLWWSVEGVIVVTLAYVSYIVLCKKPRNTNLESEVVLITGGAQGLGKAFAKTFAALGATVILWDRQSEKLYETKLELEEQGANVEVAELDLRDVALIRAAAKEIDGRVTVLVNNASVASVKPFLELTDEQIDNTFKVNVAAHFYTARAFLPAMMKKNKGCIVTICSVLGHIGAKDLTDYCSSKAALVGYHESLVMELSVIAPEISTIIVQPATLDTTMFEHAINPPFLSYTKATDVASSVAHVLLDGYPGKYTTLTIPALFHAIPIYEALPTALKVWLMHVTDTVNGLRNVKGTQ
eukprot:CFRG6259T1